MLWCHRLQIYNFLEWFTKTRPNIRNWTYFMQLATNSFKIFSQKPKRKVDSNSWPLHGRRALFRWTNFLTHFNAYWTPSYGKPNPDPIFHIWPISLHRIYFRNRTGKLAHKCGAGFRVCPGACYILCITNASKFLNLMSTLDGILVKQSF